MTALAPAKTGKAWLLWPFAADSQPRQKGLGGLPGQPGRVLTHLLASLSGLGFLAAALGLFGVIIPSGWLGALVVVSAIFSALLHML